MTQFTKQPKRFALISVAAFSAMITLSGCGGDDDNEVVHYQGKDCLVCHSTGEYAFSSGGTIFRRIDGADEDINAVATDYTLRLALENGTLVTFTKGMGYGNAHWKGDTGAIDNFTAQVLDPNGNVVNSSNPNSHNVGMLACNRCHSATGTDGAPGRIVSYNLNEESTVTPVTIEDPTFSANIMPILTDKCASCHSTTSNNGFIVDTTDNVNAYKEVMYYINTVNPTGSLLLVKATGNEHALIFDADSTEYDTILKWIEAGAINN